MYATLFVDVVVRNQASQVVQNVSVSSSSVQEKDAKISALSSPSCDDSRTIRMIIPDGIIPPVKTLELSNYNRDSSVLEKESIHANTLTSAIMERSENVVVKPVKMGNTQMPNKCSTAGFLGHSTSSFGNKLFSLCDQCHSFPCDLIRESLTDKKLESLLPFGLPTRCEQGLRGEKDSFLGKSDPLISVPERDVISCKKGEEILLPGIVAEHQKMEWGCKAAELQTPFSFSASDGTQLVSVASATFSQGFSTYDERYSFIPLDLEGKDQNKFTVVDTVKGSICYAEAPTRVQSLQTTEDKLRSCSGTLGSPIQKRKSRKARDKQRCSAGLSMPSSDSSNSEAGHILRASSPVLSKKQRRKRRSPVEQLLRDYLHQVSSSDVDIDGLELPQLAKLKSPTV